jgi:hypothetical protein
MGTFPLGIYLITTMLINIFISIRFYLTKFNGNIETFLRVVKTYPADGLRREPQYLYFNVDPLLPVPDVEKIKSGAQPLETDKNA